MSRGNELVIRGHRLLRFPTVAMRPEPERIVDQLRRIHQSARAAA